MVVFVADHGDMMGDHGFWGKCLHDQGTRVPLIVRAPGMVDAGKTSDAMVQLVDLLPTFLQAAGAPDFPCAGRPLTAWMENGGRRFAVTEYENSIMICDGRLKYSRKQRGGTEFNELYDLESDPDEFVNVWKRAAEYEGFAAMRDELDRLERDEAALSTLFYDGKGVPPWMKA